MWQVKRTVLSVCVTAVFGLLAHSGASAGVSPEEAQKLKNGELTPMGAEMAGNEDGSIPKWTGGLITVPDAARIKAKQLGYKCYKGSDCLDGDGAFAKGLHLLDPFPEDKPWLCHQRIVIFYKLLICNVIPEKSGIQ